MREEYIVDAVEEEVNGKVVRGMVLIDQWPEDPRDWSTLARLYLDHRQYDLPKEIPGFTPDQYGYESLDEFISDIERQTGRKIIEWLPVHAIDHGGLHILTGVNGMRAIDTPDYWWDGGLLGVAVMFRDDVQREFRVKRITKRIREQAMKILAAELKAYAAYVEGAAFGYVVEVDGEVVDSCWGYLDHDHVVEEMREAVTAAVRQLSDGVELAV